MNSTKTIAALFDFDGVVMDTETQYTVFWDAQGKEFLGKDDFGRTIKGQTLTQIFDKYFSDIKEAQTLIEQRLEAFEKNMKYEYLPGVVDFINDLRQHHVKTALVTSSNKNKMSNVYRVHPEISHLFDEILTAEHFSKSKPNPECFLLGMSLLNSQPDSSYVFEDSFHGLQAGMDSGATVIGLATTNSRDAIQGKAHHVIDDFSHMTYDKLIFMS